MHLARLSLKSSHQVAVGCFVVRGQGDGSGGEKGEIVPLLQLLPYQTSVGKASLGGMGQTKDEPNQGGRGVARGGPAPCSQHCTEWTGGAYHTEDNTRSHLGFRVGLDPNKTPFQFQHSPKHTLMPPIQSFQPHRSSVYVILRV